MQMMMIMIGDNYVTIGESWNWGESVFARDDTISTQINNGNLRMKRVYGGNANLRRYLNKHKKLEDLQIFSRMLWLWVNREEGNKVWKAQVCIYLLNPLLNKGCV